MRVALLVIASFGAAPLGAQSSSPGKGVFWDVEYRGGDSHIKSSEVGSIMLTDSTVEFYKANGRVPMLVIPIVKISAISGRSNRIGASLTNWASGDESLTITYDGSNDAEAPVFKTGGSETAQIEARIRYRMRKLGVAGEGAKP